MRITFAGAINYALSEEMKRDSQVFLLGEDVGAYGGAFGVSQGLLDKFSSKRIMDTPISEASLMGIATGAALLGQRPILEIMFMDFTTLIIDQILNHCVKLKYMFGGDDRIRIPLVIRTPFGGGRAYGASHSQSLEALFMHMPGLKILCPSTVEDAAGLLISAIRDDNPVLFLENKLLYQMEGELEPRLDPTPMGSARIARQGRDVTVAAYGRMVYLALDAARQLEQDGISVEVLDLRSLAPLDIDSLCGSVEKTGRIVTLEEGTLTGGSGAEICARIMEGAFYSLDAPPVRIAARDLPIPYSPVLEAEVLPGIQQVIEGIRKTLQ